MVVRALDSPLSQAQLDFAPRLRDALQTHDYTEEKFRQALGLRDVCLAKLGEIPGFAWRLQQDPSPITQLACLWHGRQCLERPQVEQLLSREVTDFCVELGLLRQRGTSLRARVDIYPVREAFIVTDPALLEHGCSPGHVYQLGSDSYFLARMTPRNGVDGTLDLCTGSGVHGVLASFHSNAALGVDLNPRALTYARFNGALNQKSPVFRVQESDLYSQLDPGLTFDLITANPPFVPTPDAGMDIHRTGGETGEELSSRIVGGLAERLRPGGLFAMVLDYPVFRDSTYLERLRQWAGPGRWGVAVLDLARFPANDYIAKHIDFSLPWPDYCRSYASYLESYSRLGLEEVRAGLVYLKKLEEPQQAWDLNVGFPSDPVDSCSLIGEWLESLTRGYDPGWPEPEMRPQLAEDVNLYLDHRETHGFLAREVGWPKLCRLSQEEAKMARACDGSLTADELKEKFGPETYRSTLNRLGEFAGLR